MFKRWESETILGVVLIFFFGFLIVSHNKILEYLVENQRKSMQTMEGHFNDLFLSEHLRNISHDSNFQALSFLATKNEVHKKNYDAEIARFNSVLQKLYSSRNPSEEVSRHLDKITELENRRAFVIGNSFAKEKLRPFSSYQSSDYFQVNQQLKKALKDLIDFEIRSYAVARSEVIKARNETLHNVTIVSETAILTSLILLIIVWLQVKKVRLAHEKTLAAVKSRDEILAVVSHDLKSPLTSIGLNGQLMLRRLNKETHPDDKAINSLQSIQRSVENMQDLIQGLLDKSKLDAGKLELELKKENFSEVLQETEAILMPLAQKKSIQIVNNIPVNTEIICDKRRFKQILSNLIGNAIKFLSDEGKVEVLARQIGDRLEVSIIDNGPGIPKQDLPRLFDKFWQAKKTSSQGTGLGLVIVKDLVTAHGGDIWVESKLNQGTKFSFTVPLASS